MSDYMESLFQGIEVIVDKKLETLAYDKTEICTIINSNDCKNGRYRVSNGNLSYIAYSDNDGFRNGEQVRVNIPKGDMTQKKFIIGKYVVDENASPLTYVSPLESVVNISGNLLTPILGQREYGILANGPEKKKILWNQKLSTDKFRDLRPDGIYNTLIVKADFKTLLYNQSYVTGTYGLRIDLLVRPSEISTKFMKRTVEFSSKEMFGDPYNFAVYSPQAKTFKIVADGIIDGIELSLYQNGDFTNERQELVKPPIGMADNILIKNIELGFGSDLLDVEDNVVRIYCEDSLKFNYNPHSESTNKKKIGLVWYNKDEKNQYVGFSDGVYPKNENGEYEVYDEFAYLIEAATDLRLLAQKGRENIPTDEQGLNFAANIEEAVPILYKISSMLTQDLCGELNSLKTLASGDSGLTAKITALVTQLTEVSTKLRDGEGVNNQIAELKKMYENSLLYVYKQINHLALEGDKPPVLNDIFTNINKLIKNNNTVASNANWLDWVVDAVKGMTPKKGFKEVYDNYFIRIQRVIEKIQDVINTLPKKMDEDFSILTDYVHDSESILNHDNYKPYGEKDLSKYAKTYAIYWYRYEEDYVDKENEYKLMPDGWRLMRPGIDESLDGISLGYTGLPSKNMNGDSSVLNEDGKETFAALLTGDNGFIYPYMRNDKKEEKFVAIVCYDHAIYRSNELIFENSQKDQIPDKHTLNKSDALRFEHLTESTDSYFLYNDNTKYLYDTADEYKAREIRCHYDGILSKDEALAKAGIYWYIPKGSTMITYDEEYLTTKGFDNDLGGTRHYSKDGYVCFYKQIINAADTGNEEENKKLQAKGFTVSSTHDDRSFWYQIKPVYDPSTTQNHIICKVTPCGDIDSVESSEWFTFGTMGTNGTKYTLAISKPSDQSAIYFDNSTLYLNLELKDATNTPVSLDDKSPSVVWYMHTGEGDYLNYTGKDGIPPHQIQIGSHRQCGILKASANVGIQSFEEKDSTSEEQIASTRTVQLEYLYSVPYSNGRYYISGPTYIVYNNLGTLDKNSFYDGSYQIFNFDTKQEVSATWSLEFYKVGANESRAITSLTSPYNTYMPTLQGKYLVPSTLYLEGNDYIPVIVAKQGATVLWKQPIIITQNRYPSTLLNNWDGRFQLDESAGTILSTMIGAGRKNPDANTFDGILMGNVQQAAEINSMIGLYGFNNGAQSFGLRIDGTAFFGKAGRGRIEIDGNNGTISSAAYEQNKDKTNKAGMLIDLDDGFIDILGTSWKNESQGLYQAETNQSHIRISSMSPYFEIESNNGNPLICIGNADDKYFLQSDNYSTTDGMKINLKTGHIDAYNFKLSSENVLIDSSKSSTYFQVKSDTGEILMNIGTGNYYLQSVDYVEGTKGTRIDLNNGAIRAHDFKLTAGNKTSGGVFIDSAGSEYFYAGTPSSHIQLTSSGLTVNTTNFTVDTSGNIFADSGKIGGWHLSSLQLYNEQYFASTSNKTIVAESSALLKYRAFIQSLPSSGTSLWTAFGLYKYTRENTSAAWAQDAQFFVNYEGKLVAKNAEIHGHIEATSGSFSGHVNASSGSFSGTITAGAGTIGGWKINADNISSVDGNTKLNNSGNISGAEITGGSIKIGPSDDTIYFSVSETSKVQISNSVGFLTMGTTNHPYVSALNVAGTENAISFRSTTGQNNAGSQKAALGISGDDWLKVSATSTKGVYFSLGSKSFSIDSFRGKTGQAYLGGRYLLFYKGILAGVSDTNYDPNTYPNLLV